MGGGRGNGAVFLGVQASERLGIFECRSYCVGGEFTQLLSHQFIPGNTGHLFGISS